jgi:hypothetical protein
VLVERDVEIAVGDLRGHRARAVGWRSTRRRAGVRNPSWTASSTWWVWPPTPTIDACNRFNIDPDAVTGMYAVVGCSDCEALWIVEGRPDTTQCPRCRRRHQFDRLKTFAETDGENEARDARAAMLAERSDADVGADALEPFGAMEGRAAEAGVSDEEYLEGSGIDPDTVADAGESPNRGGSSRREVVLSALREIDAPTESDVVAYATARGVPAEYVAEALEKLVRAGEVSESGGEYRTL